MWFGGHCRCTSTDANEWLEVSVNKGHVVRMPDNDSESNLLRESRGQLVSE